MCNVLIWQGVNRICCALILILMASHTMCDAGDEADCICLRTIYAIKSERLL